ncbi:ABC transporter ATP-binding protein [Permianibacter sp. IMCC34836]|uniref:ABC transporter ATP-binding protein n=1 Tax=Permianibacter fluminis TaxID=2738515 RepID=UPI00155323EA|nr:ABC transporter ATP-binding protein [Permianibacter fluminis]NQD38777.1 ABC transporter ATP-binding protein [Permianibacter fluminis]
MEPNSQQSTRSKTEGQANSLPTREVVRCEGVSQRVPTSEGPLDILTDINLAIQSGESVAIVGASGSGKSTLLGLLAGLDTPSHGDIWLDGEPLRALNEDSRAALRARKVGFVFQSFHLLPALSALENVMLPLEIAGVSEAEATARQWLDRVGLGSRLSHSPRQLSGGEQQRVAIARAFATQPAILFADEPTGNLDRATGARIIELLFALNAEQGTTLVLVTHDDALARRCQHRLMLAAGRLVTEVTA